jgi:RNA polymerase sigma factor (sigma-70 family)
MQTATSTQTPLTQRIGMDDSVLLGRYVESGCQESFEAIVARHSGWVFSLSLRAVRDRHLAEDVTQAVFIILARKARTIRHGTPLSGWLFKVSRFAAGDALKHRRRMNNREHRFAEFFKAAKAGDGAAADAAAGMSDDLSQTLDDAVSCLADADRQAILLRFYEGKNLAEVGAIMGTSEEAAKKRVSRAVDKLRKYFANRGVVASIALVLLLLSQRSDAAGAVPMILAPAAAPSIAHAIADGALKLMAHAHAKLLGAIFAGGLALLISLPALSGAFPRRDAIPIAAAPPTAQPLPEIAFETVEIAPPKLPEPSRFADLWIGYKGQLLWRSDAYRDPNPLPFYLKAADQQERPYAVAVDPKGDFFIRPLDQAILESPVIRLSQSDYDPVPAEPTARVFSMLSLLEPPPSGFSILPHAASKLLAEQSWHKLRRSEDIDGTPIVEQRAPLRVSPFNFGGDGMINSIDVPEPSGTLLLLGAAAFVALRRKRHPR